MKKSNGYEGIQEIRGTKASGELLLWVMGTELRIELKEEKDWFIY